MTWREEFLKIRINGKLMIAASFRGAVFFVEDSTRSGGRRLAEDDFPYSDEGFTDDLGRKRRKISLSGYVVGPDYIQRRDELIEALESSDEEPGELVHPTSGRLPMRCDSYDCSERIAEEGGIARFKLTFTDPLDGGLSFERIQSIAVDVAAARAVVAEDYLQTATPNQVDGDFLTPIERAVEEFGATVREPFAALLESAQDSGAFRARVDALIENAAGIAADPALMLFEIGGLMQSDFRPPSVPGNIIELAAKVNGLFAALSALLSPSPYDTDTRRKQAILHAATVEMMSCQVALTTCGLAGELSDSGAIEDYQSSVTIRTGVVGMLDERGETPGFENTQNAMDGLRGVVYARIPKSGQSSELRQYYTPNVSTSSLLLAYRFYGGTARELQLCARNRASEPGFIMGGQPVEILRA